MVKGCASITNWGVRFLHMNNEHNLKREDFPYDMKDSRFVASVFINKRSGKQDLLKVKGELGSNDTSSL